MVMKNVEYIKPKNVLNLWAGAGATLQYMSAFKNEKELKLFLYKHKCTNLINILVIFVYIQYS